MRFDSVVPGLALKVYPTGKKSYVLDYREAHGRQRRVVIGSPPVWSIGKARRHASRLGLRIDVGEEVTPRRGVPLATLVKEWFDEVIVPKRRPLTITMYRRLFARHIVPAFGQRDARTISRDEVERWHNRIA